MSPGLMFCFLWNAIRPFIVFNDNETFCCTEQNRTEPNQTKRSRSFTMFISLKYGKKWTLKRDAIWFCEQLYQRAHRDDFIKCIYYYYYFNHASSHAYVRKCKFKCVFGLAFHNPFHFAAFLRDGKLTYSWMMIHIGNRIRW